MKKVVVFSSTTCPYCTSVKEYLDAEGVEFEEKNITTDSDARNELIRMGYRGVPVTIIDGETIVGFDKERIAKELA